ncbi:MAG: FtsX-like permease family protein [Cyclobacteriaceae bacterium]|nr:FtsX-like permease family protein [Cyclobacteriaceae bacterium]
MKLAFQLAYRNLMGSGLRTWLNVSVLSFAFVVIIFYNGLIDGWNEQAKRDGVAWEYGKGQLLNENYDPFDPFTLQDGHGTLKDAQQKELIPVLIRQATIYPQGRMLSVALKGIDVNQTLIELPTYKLAQSKEVIPALIGKRMAETAKLKMGDQVLLRWRDKNGTYDAASVTVVDIFDTNVPTVDNGQVWIPIEKLWAMTELQNHATLYINASNRDNLQEAGWTFRSQKMLLKEISDIIEMKKSSGFIMYGLLLAISLLAIFDTQVLSIFRRQREIGTYIALGMTRLRVVGLFTIEGSMYSLLASLLGCLYGIPLFIYLANTGIGMPGYTENTGIIIAERIFPVYSLSLVLGTLVLVVLSSTLVSFLPSRKIAKMDPVDALKGKLQ